MEYFENEMNVKDLFFATFEFAPDCELPPIAIFLTEADRDNWIADNMESVTTWADNDEMTRWNVESYREDEAAHLLMINEQLYSRERIAIDYDYITSTMFDYLDKNESGDTILMTDDDIFSYDTDFVIMWFARYTPMLLDKSVFEDWKKNR